MNDAANQIAQLEILTRLQRILGEGQFVASYIVRVMRDE